MFLGDEKCHRLTLPERSPYSQRGDTIYSKGLKFNIILVLVALLMLGMMMTVLVMDMLWQRDILRKEVARAQGQLSLLLSLEMIPADFQGSPLFDKKKFASILRETGALAGLIYYDSNNDILFGSPEVDQQHLQRTIEKVIASGKKQHALFGASWGILLPQKKYLSVAVPILQNKTVIGGMGLVIPLTPVYASMSADHRIIFVYLLVNLIVLTVIGLFRFVAITVRPVENLVRLTDSYKEEDGIPFLSLQAGDEFGQLSRSLNQMLKRIEGDRKKLQSSVQSLEQANKELVATREEMVRTEKLASVGRLAAGLAHEIGNPIGVVQGYIELLQQDNLTREDRREFALRSENELQRINRLVRQLLDFSRADSEQQEEVSIHTTLRELVEMVTCQPLMNGVEISTDLTAANDVVRGGTDQLQQVFLNCLLNAADALASVFGNKKKIEIKTMLDKGDTVSGRQHSILVLITDTGTGIAEKDRANVFDPFFTTKEPGKGTGLGLSVAYSIVDGYGGSMRVESRLKKGTTVFIELPLALRREPGEIK